MVQQGYLIPVHVVAKQLGVSERTVRNLVVRGEIEAVRIGSRNYRIIKESVLRYLDMKKYK